jgi:hypothetical protein
LHRIKKYITLAKEINKLKHKTMTKEFFYDLQKVTNNLIDYRNELHDKKNYSKVQQVNTQIRKNIKLLTKYSK